VHCRYRERGGEDGVVDTEADLLRAGGHDVVRHEVANPEGAAASASLLVRSPWNRRAAAQVADAARRVRADVVHVHNTWYALSPAVFGAVRATGTPTVLTLHNFRVACIRGDLFRDGRACEDCVGGTPWPGVRHRCYRNSVATSACAAVTLSVHRARRTWHRDVDRFVALSEFSRDLLARAGVPRERVSVLPNVAAEPGPRPAPPSASRTVLFVGRLSEEKGADLLLDAWRRARPCGLELTVVGDGPAASTVAAHDGMGVRWLGSQPVDAVAAQMLSARALVVPSRCYENFPRVVAEAFAAGLPVLAPAHGGVGEVVGRHLGPRWLFDAGSAEALAARLGALDDAIADRAGAAGRETWEAELRPQHGLARLEAVYGAVA
jgi:glycosyltransferase involved in cell wall biosynthesis